MATHLNKCQRFDSFGRFIINYLNFIVMKNVKNLILSELVSGSKAAKILKSDYSDDVIELLSAIETVQTFVNKKTIVEQVGNAFVEKEPNEFIKFLDSQLPDSQKGKINGANLCEKIISVAKRTKLK